MTEPGTEFKGFRPLRPDETPQDLSRAGYNSAAKAYNDWLATLVDRETPYAERLICLLDTSSPVGESGNTARLLELGCGAGSLSMMKFVQSSTVDHVTGVDISSAQLELARANLQAAGASREKYELVEADMLSVEFDAHSFDAICGFYSIIQLSPDQQRTMLKRAFDWVKPGGYLVFNVGEEESGGGVIEGWLGMQPGAYWSSFGKDGSLQVLRDVGFVVDDATTIQDPGDAAFVFIVARKPV